MKVRGLLLTSLGLSLTMLGFGFWVADDLKPGTRLAIHWNLAGDVDRTAPALLALTLPAAAVLFIGMVFTMIPRIDPLQHRLEASAPVVRAAWIGSMLVMIYLQMLIAAPALTWPIGPDLLLVGLGALLVMVGDALPKSRRSLFVGIRTPWTLRDTDNWVATHRLGGKMMIAGGLIVLLAFIPMLQGHRVMVVAALAASAALVPVGYSWWLARRSAA